MPSPRALVRLQAASAWDGSWVYVPWLRFQSCRDCVNPEMPKATFRYDFGEQKREHTTKFFTETPLSIAGHYVQILLQMPGDDPEPVWHGVLQDDMVRTEGDLRLEGPQTLHAWGLQHLLDLQPIDRAFCEQGTAVVEIRRLPKFNERHQWGESLVGNRSSTKYTIPGTTNQAYVLRAKGSGDTWTNLDLLEYVLASFTPPGWTIVVTGQYAALDQLKEVHDPSRWSSVWDALNALIPRKKGFAFVLETTGSGPIYLRVCTLTETALGFGGYELPANAWPTVLTLPTAFPWNHLVDPLEVRFTQLSQVDELLVQSTELLRVVASLSYHPRGSQLDAAGATTPLTGDGTLVEGWSVGPENDFRNPPGATNGEQRDASRSDDRFADVFRRHLIGIDRLDPTKFDWMVGNGTGGAKVNMALFAGDDGTVGLGTAWPAPGPQYWNSDRQVLRELPFESQKRYETSPIGDTGASGGQPDYVPVLAVMRDPLKTAEHYFVLDRPPDDTLPAIGIQPIDKGLGVKLTTSHGVTLAKDHWTGGGDTLVSSKFLLDYRDLIVTAAFEMDQRLQVRLQGLSFPAHHTTRKRVFEVPGIHYWRAAPDTIIGVDAGALKRIHANNLVLRDDSGKLQAFAAFLRYFFGVYRQAITVPIKTLGTFVPLGSMLLGVDGVSFSTPVNTLITSRTLTQSAVGPQARLQTMIETGFWSLDEARGMFA